jgi:L-ascorbate metabolism protein UlaG (beta-lactamase superfamily)
MKITYYGHSCFGAELNGKHLLFDPFVSGNALAKDIVDINTIPADYILVSHGHADHIWDAEAIARRTGAKIVCSWEIYEWFGKKGLENSHPMNTGGEWNFGDFTAKCTAAQHSSGLPDGTYGGNPMGFIVSGTEGKFYYSGDTALTYDMKIVGEFEKPDFALLPIGSNFTMGVDDAIRAAQWAGVKKVIGLHYDTFGYIVVDHADAVSRFAAAGIELILMEIGSTIEI